MDLQSKFNKWIDNLLIEKPLPENVMAINFNLYNISEKSFDVQLIASSIYDENDDDWACEEIYSSKENCFNIPKSKEIGDNEIALETVEEMVAEYLDHGKYSSNLKNCIAICAGFVDDRLECIWNSDDELDDETFSN